MVIECKSPWNRPRDDSLCYMASDEKKTWDQARQVSQTVIEIKCLTLISYNANVKFRKCSMKFICILVLFRRRRNASGAKVTARKYRHCQCQCARQTTKYR